MNDQGELFDPISLEEGERRRDVGMARAWYATPDAWAAGFERALVALLKSGRTRVTSEDIVQRIGLPPGHPNAVGAVMRACAVRHNLRNVGTVKASRVARHAGRITVWERL